MGTTTIPSTIPSIVHPDAWHAAIEAAYGKALSGLPNANGRVERAYSLVKAGAVEHLAQWGEHHYTVASESDPDGLTMYDVHALQPSTCTCEDYERHATEAGWICKHIIACWIYHRAVEHLAAQLPAAAPVHQSAPHRPSAAPLPEAAFSLCLKGRLAGQDAQLTIRGQTYEQFAANVQRVRGMLDAPCATPPAPPASLGAPAGAAQPTPEGWCLVHQCQMKRQTNQRGSWWSHKEGDGWCRGTSKGA